MTRFNRSGSRAVAFTAVHRSAKLLALVVQLALWDLLQNSADDFQCSVPVLQLAGCQITQKEYRISLGSESLQTGNTAK